MIFRRRSLPRRTFLRGSSALLGLPLLDAMVPAMTAAAATPAAPAALRRLGFVYMPMGCDHSRWRPPSKTSLETLSTTLEPLEPVKQQVVVISNLELRNAYPGTHATSNASFLSAAMAKRTESTDYHLGTTVDQIAAKHLGGQTPLASLEMSMDLMSVVGQCDNGYACVYQNCLSWSSPTTPLPAEAHPRLIFERLFGDGGSPQQRLQSLQRRASILDSVRESWHDLKREVGTADNQRIEQYLESIRSVELRIEKGERSVADQPVIDTDRPLGVPESYAAHARLMFELQRLALQADVTRVITFQLARETSNRVYHEIGVNEPHHPLTHHGNDPEKIAQVATINRFHVSLFAEFLQSLRETAEGDGTLLDHVLYLYGSGMGNPNVHNHLDLPILVAGGGAGHLQGGRHLAFDKPMPLANLHLTLLDRIGVSQQTFADSDGTIGELFEPLPL
jgi:hypothetical protein